MSDTGVADPNTHVRPSTIDLGHPVRSFVLAMLGVSLVLALVQWSGLVMPDLRAATTSFGATIDGRQYVALLLDNEGRLPIRIEDVAFEADGWTEVSVVVQAPGDGISAAIPTGVDVDAFPLSGGVTATRWIVVAGRPPCGPQRRPPEIEVTVRSWIGAHRTIGFPVNGPSVSDPDGSESSCP
jgi:hypothetical protein